MRVRLLRALEQLPEVSRRRRPVVGVESFLRVLDDRDDERLGDHPHRVRRGITLAHKVPVQAVRNPLTFQAGLATHQDRELTHR
jgi:hypothetical protein